MVKRNKLNKMYFQEDEHREIFGKMMPYFYNCFTTVFFTYTFYRIFNLKEKIINHLIYTPGVGVIKSKKRSGQKEIVVDTTCGKIPLPKVKAPSFDLDMGFLPNDTSRKTGMQTLESFENHSGLIKLAFFERYWITPYFRPRDVNGKDYVCGFIRSEIDDLIYIFSVEENKPIDYEKIISDYETEIETMDELDSAEQFLGTERTEEELLNEEIELTQALEEAIVLEKSVEKLKDL